MARRFSVNGEPLEAEILAHAPQLRVRLAERTYTVGAVALADGEFALTIDGQRLRGAWCALADGVQVRLNGRSYTVQAADRSVSAADDVAQREVRASMPGVVVAVHCIGGQALAAGERLLTLESMKLQMTLVTPHAARVEQVHVAAETVFERGALLISLAPLAAEDA